MQTEKSYCPYCNTELVKRPVRKSKCPHCKKSIYIKYSPSNRNKRLVTEDEAGRIDAEWSRHYREQEILRLMNNYDLNFEQINQIQNKHRDEDLAPAKIEIEILRKLLKDPVYVKNHLWQLSRLIHLLNDSGSDTLELQITENKYKLREIADKGFLKTEIYCSSDCIYYKSHHTLKLTASKEMEHPRIPTRQCTRDIDGNYKVCMCTYKPFFN